MSDFSNMLLTARIHKNKIDNALINLKQEFSRQTKAIFKTKKTIQSMQIIKRRIQALEGDKDVLSTWIIENNSESSKVIDKNNYIVYSKQVVSAYDMYEAKLFNGAELFGAVTDARVACICGEGINFKCIPANKKKEDFIRHFFKMNKLQGSNLLNIILTGELEGRNLLILTPEKINIKNLNSETETLDKDKSFVRVSEFLWVNNQYTVIPDANNTEIMKSYKYKKNKDSVIEDEVGNFENAVYVRLGGTKRNINETTHRLHRCLTQFENISRAGYDLRKNSHLFGKIKPVATFNYQDPDADKNVSALSNNMDNKTYDIGSGLVTTGDFKFVAPPADGVTVILKDIIENLRLIATNTGIPIHWLSYPELMNARATAENVSRMMEYSTKKDRLIWEEKIKELIEKAMTIAVNALAADNEILIGDFEIKLPLIDMDKVIEMIKELFVLVTANIIPASYLLNRLPGVDPEQIAREIEEQKAKQKAEDEESIHNDIEINRTKPKIRLDNNDENADNNQEDELDEE